MAVRQIAIDVFNRIRNSFPTLTSSLYLECAHVEISLEYPLQPGLKYEVNLNLQNNDELHLSASALWVEWFPCREPEIVEEYFNAVCGLLSGSYRIVEYHVRGKAFKAHLQKPVGTKWQTIHRWGRLHWPSFGMYEIVIVQNSPAP